MARAAEDASKVEVRSRAQLQNWLAANHDTGGSVWLVTFKQHTDPYLAFGDLIEELLCWGWIDSWARGADSDRTSVLIAPRNPKSAWSAINKDKIAAARASGAMMQAGEEALIAAAKSSRMWSFLDDVERLERPADLDAALGDLVVSWEAYPRSIKRAALEWIKTAKTAATRQKRIAVVVSSLESGQRLSPFRS